MKKKSNIAKERSQDQVASVKAAGTRSQAPSAQLPATSSTLSSLSSSSSTSCLADVAECSTITTETTHLDPHHHARLKGKKKSGSIDSNLEPESDAISSHDLCAIATATNSKCKKVKLDHLSKSSSVSNLRASSCTVCAPGHHCSQSSCNQSAASPTVAITGSSSRRSTPPDGSSHPAFARRAPIATMCTQPGCQCQASLPATTPLSTATEALTNGAIDASVGATLPSESADHPSGNQEDDLACIDYALSDACTDTYVAEVKKIIREKRMTGQDSLLLLACCNGYYELAQFLLSTKVNIEERGSNDMTPLMEAASSGYANIVQLLLDHGAKLDAQTPQGNTALIYACANGCSQVVTVLLTYAQRLPDISAFIEASNENGHTALMEAASAGHVDIAKHLVACNASINTHSNSFKESALTLACYKGNLEMVRFLLEAGADHEHKTEEMHTALMEASMDGHLKVAELLIESGARVNMPVDSFESPLTLAACGGHVELALLLLKNGANIEEVNDEGYTPLMEAAREGHEEMVALLLSQGAEMNAQTEETQETALTLTCCGGFLEVADFLIRSGADIEAGATTPLMEAAQEGHLSLCNLLLFHRANVNACSLSCDTALMYASENDHAQVVKLLLANGADIEAEAEGGRTALMKAARAGHLNTVHVLVEHGADVNRATASNDHTALSLACVAGHKNVVQYLLMNNANYNYRLKDNSTMLIEAAKGGHVDIVKVLMDFSNGIERMCGQLVVQELNNSDQPQQQPQQLNVPQSQLSQSSSHSQPLPLTPVMRQHAQQQLQQAFVQQLQQQHSQPQQQLQQQLQQQTQLQTQQQPQQNSHPPNSSQILMPNSDQGNIVQQSPTLSASVSLKKKATTVYHPQQSIAQNDHNPHHSLQPIAAHAPQYVAPSTPSAPYVAKSMLSESGNCSQGRAKRPRASRQLSDPTLDSQRVSVASDSVYANPSPSVFAAATAAASAVAAMQSKSSAAKTSNGATISPVCLTNMFESNLADFKNSAVLNAAAYESWMYSTLNEMGEGNREAIYQAGLALGRRHILQETERLEQCINHMMRRTEQLNPSREEQIKQKQQILDELHRVEKELQERAQIQLIISQLKQHKQHLQAIYSSHHAHCQSADSIASQFLSAIEAVSDSQIVKEILVSEQEGSDAQQNVANEWVESVTNCDLTDNTLQIEALTNDLKRLEQDLPVDDHEAAALDCNQVHCVEGEQIDGTTSNEISEAVVVPKMKKRACLEHHQKQLRDKMSELFGLDASSGDVKEFLKKAVHEFNLEQHIPLILPQLFDRLNEVEQALQSEVENEIAQRKKSVAKRRINKSTSASIELSKESSATILTTDKTNDMTIVATDNVMINHPTQSEQEMIERNLIPIVEPFPCNDSLEDTLTELTELGDSKVYASSTLLLEPYGTKIQCRTLVPLDYTATNQRYSRESQTLVTNSSGVFQICLGLDFGVDNSPVISVHKESDVEPVLIEMVERGTQTIQYGSNNNDDDEDHSDPIENDAGSTMPLPDPGDLETPCENSMNVIKATFDWSVAMRLALYAVQPIRNEFYLGMPNASSNETTKVSAIDSGDIVLNTEVASTSDPNPDETLDEAVMKALLALDGLERMEQVLRESKLSDNSSDTEMKTADEKLRQKWARLKGLKKQYLLSVKQCENARNQPADSQSPDDFAAIATRSDHESNAVAEILTDSKYHVSDTTEAQPTACNCTGDSSTITTNVVPMSTGPTNPPIHTLARRHINKAKRTLNTVVSALSTTQLSTTNGPLQPATAISSYGHQHHLDTTTNSTSQAQPWVPYYSNSNDTRFAINMDFTSDVEQSQLSSAMINSQSTLADLSGNGLQPSFVTPSALDDHLFASNSPLPAESIVPHSTPADQVWNAHALHLHHHHLPHHIHTPMPTVAGAGQVPEIALSAECHHESDHSGRLLNLTQQMASLAPFTSESNGSLPTSAGEPQPTADSSDGQPAPPPPPPPPQQLSRPPPPPPSAASTAAATVSTLGTSATAAVIDGETNSSTSAQAISAPAAVVGSTSEYDEFVNLQTDSNHDTALTLACAGGHADLVRLLLNRGARIEHRDKKGFTPLMLAATAGHVRICELLLLRNADLEAQTERSKDTALSLACSSGRYEVVEMLLAKGANKEHRNASDYTPLSLAASGGYVQIIKLLLQNGVEINSRSGSKLGISPLMLAAMNGHTESVRLLLDMGGDINAQIETNKNTALTLACFQGRCEVVSLLLDRKANVEHRAKTGLTPLMEAASGGYVDVGRVLLEKGADINALPVPSSKDTALTIAADKGHVQFIQLLLLHGVQLDVRNKKGSSPLWLACNGGHFDVMKLLVESKCDVDSQDNRKVSCLMAAFRKGHTRLVKWLVSHITQFPNDQEMIRYNNSITDHDLRKRCETCRNIIEEEKRKQSLKADKHATILIEEETLEESKKLNRKLAASKKREKKKMKRKEKMGKVDDDKPSTGDHSIADSQLDAKEDDDNESLYSNDAKMEALSLDSSFTSKESKSFDKSLKNSKVVDLSSTKKIDFEKDDLENRPALSNVVPVRSKESKETAKGDKVETPKVKSAQKTETKPTKNNNRSSKDNNQKKELEPKAELTISSGNKSSERKEATEVASRNQFIEIKKENDSLHKIGRESPSGQQSFDKLPPSNPSRTINNRVPTSQFANVLCSSPSANSNSAAASSNGVRKEDDWKEVVRRQKKVCVPANAISRVIGRGGCNINMIREVSGAYIEVEKQKGQGDRMVIIKGSNESTRNAQQLINLMVHEPDKELHQIIVRLGLSRPTTDHHEHSHSSTSSNSIASINVSSSASAVTTTNTSSNATSNMTTINTTIGKAASLRIAPPLCTSSASSSSSCSSFVAASSVSKAIPFAAVAAKSITSIGSSSSTGSASVVTTSNVTPLKYSAVANGCASAAASAATIVAGTSASSSASNNSATSGASSIDSNIRSRIVSSRDATPCSFAKIIAGSSAANAVDTCTANAATNASDDFEANAWPDNELPGVRNKSSEDAQSSTSPVDFNIQAVPDFGRSNETLLQPPKPPTTPSVVEASQPASASTDNSHKATSSSSASTLQTPLPPPPTAISAEALEKSIRDEAEHQFHQQHQQPQSHRSHQSSVFGDNVSVQIKSPLVYEDSSNHQKNKDAANLSQLSPVVKDHATPNDHCASNSTVDLFAASLQRPLEDLNVDTQSQPSDYFSPFNSIFGKVAQESVWGQSKDTFLDSSSINESHNVSSALIGSTNRSSLTPVQPMPLTVDASKAPGYRGNLHMSPNPGSSSSFGPIGAKSAPCTPPLSSNQHNTLKSNALNPALSTSLSNSLAADPSVAPISPLVTVGNKHTVTNNVGQANLQQSLLSSNVLNNDSSFGSSNRLFNPFYMQQVQQQSSPHKVPFNRQSFASQPSQASLDSGIQQSISFSDQQLNAGSIDFGVGSPHLFNASSHHLSPMNPSQSPMFHPAQPSSGQSQTHGSLVSGVSGMHSSIGASHPTLQPSLPAQQQHQQQLATNLQLQMRAAILAAAAARYQAYGGSGNNSAAGSNSGGNSNIGNSLTVSGVGMNSGVSGSGGPLSMNQPPDFGNEKIRFLQQFQQQFPNQGVPPSGNASGGNGNNNVGMFAKSPLIKSVQHGFGNKPNMSHNPNKLFNSGLPGTHSKPSYHNAPMPQHSLHPMMHLPSQHPPQHPGAYSTHASMQAMQQAMQQTNTGSPNQLGSIASNLASSQMKNDYETLVNSDEKRFPRPIGTERAQRKHPGSGGVLASTYTGSVLDGSGISNEMLSASNLNSGFSWGLDSNHPADSQNEWMSATGHSNNSTSNDSQTANLFNMNTIGHDPSKATATGFLSNDSANCYLNGLNQATINTTISNDYWSGMAPPSKLNWQSNWNPNQN